ncbi:MAG: tRNA (N(6)-L-threonylcarbamoyladenosine(37)-C(2))-methylthiotransferase MtaB [Butyrivibrio sp.]|nr:tRNA (N(6)-L-threonylcarbamoyladenosine(37)-C(2))-methylthiotransferase MtaB [Butyrivibrio sp.]
MKKCALHNLGCKVNSYETQVMQQMMENAGYEIVPFGEEIADVYIINTCSVTNIADRKSRQMIHKARKINPDAIVVASGCYVESASDSADDDIDIVIGNNEKSRLIEILEGYFAGEPLPEKSIIGEINTFDEMKMDRPMEHTRAYIKIQDGCNRFCTYCIIPYVRGRIRSRDIENICEELKRIADSGCKEVVLTGIHLSSYGLDCPQNGYTLLDVIERANSIEGIERIRLGSLEPLIVTEEFVERLFRCEKVCPHFHLSLQSGCDETLRRMNRRYTTGEFYRGVELLRKYYDNPAITTDVIVGFPGETPEEFEITRQYLEKIKFYELHVFKYSRRKGTVADKMEGQLTDRIKSERSDVLLEMDEQFSNAYRASYIGKTTRILTEEIQEIGGEAYMTGYTDTYVKVAVPVRKCPQIVDNEIINVRITGLLTKEMVIGVAE